MDTPQQAIENFKKLGFENLGHCTREESLELIALHLSPIPITASGGEEFVVAKKRVNYSLAKSIQIDGIFLPERNSIYRLSVNPCYSPKRTLEGLSLAARGDSLYGKEGTDPIKRSKYEERRKTLRKLIYAQFKEIREDLGINPTVCVFSDPSVDLRIGLNIEGQNLAEIFDKFSDALKKLYS